MSIDYKKPAVQKAYTKAAKEYIFNTMSPEEMLNQIVRMGLHHEPMGSDAHLRATLLKGIRDQECIFEFCETYDITPPPTEAERKAAIQSKKVNSIDDILEQDKPENGGYGLLEDKNTVNCYFCQREVLDKDSQNADEYNGNDGGSICETCLEAKGDTPATSELYKCDNCDIEAHPDSLNEAKDMFQRLTVGGIYTDKECLECGALCFPIDTKNEARQLMNHLGYTDDEYFYHLKEMKSGVSTKKDTPTPCLKTDEELINYALEFLSTNLTGFEVLQLTNIAYEEEGFHDARQGLRNKLMGLKKVVAPLNDLQLKAFPEYDNTSLFVRLLELLAPQGFTDSSWRNDEWPSMINTKFVIHVSYSDNSEYSELGEMSISIIHLDEDECMTDKHVALKTIDDVVEYIKSTTPLSLA